MDFAWKDGVTFDSTSQCVQMKSDSEYALEPSTCSGEAYYICMKNLCGSGFQWYDMKSCAKVMDNTATKADALKACKELSPAANLAMPSSSSEQKIFGVF